MPRRATGNQREARTAEDLDALGYYVVSLKGSGARGAKMRRRNHPVIGDLLAIPNQYVDPGFRLWLQLEVGAHSAISAFKALRKHPLPGFVPIAVLYVYRLTKGKQRAKRAVARWYVDEHTWFPGASEAIDAIRDR